MNNNEFDQRLRDLIDSYNEPVDEKVWKGIERGLIRRKRIRIARRAGYFAAAASLVAGVFLFTYTNMDNKELIAVVESTETVEVAETAIAEVPAVTEAATTKTITKTTTKIATKASVQVATETVAAQTAETSEIAQADEPATTATEVTETASKKEQKPVQPEKSLAQQIAENKYLASNDTPAKERELIIGASSNMLALSGESTLHTFPSFSAGSGNGSTSYAIRPTMEPAHSIPLSFGLQVQLPFGERLALSAGVNYTILNSQFDALINNNAEALVQQTLHYVGIPVSVYLNVMKNDNLSFYCNVGGMLEKGLSAKYKMTYITDEVSVTSETIEGLQWSANIGVGFEYKFINLLGIYLDPSLVYFFEGEQPYSIRKEQPLQLKFELGLRFHL